MIKIDKELQQMVKKYVDLLNENNKNDKQIWQGDIVNDLIRGFFKDKQLTNDFIELETPLYIRLDKLINHKEVSADSIAPITDLQNVGVVKKIPINLDKFSTDHDTYCYDNNPGLHRGLYPYHKLKWNHETNAGWLVKTYFLIFDYDTNKLGSGIPYLKIGLIDHVPHLKYYSDDDEYIESLRNTAKEFRKDINKNIMSDDHHKLLRESMEVIEDIGFSKNGLINFEQRINETRRNPKE